VLIGLILAFLIMLMESISWRGLDNLFIPTTTFVFLKVFLELESSHLLIRLVVIVAVVLFMLWWRQHLYLSRSAVIGGALVLYASWALGSWHWLLAPAMMLAGYTLLCPRARGTQRSHHTIHGVFCIALPGIFWLFFSKSLSNANFIYPYGVSYAAHLGMVALAYFLHAPVKTEKLLPVIKSTLLGFSIPAIPYLWVWQKNKNSLLLALGALVLVLAAVTAFSRWEPRLANSPNDVSRWVRQGFIGFGASVLAVIYITLIEPWSASF
jgi:phytol kinase